MVYERLDKQLVSMMQKYENRFDATSGLGSVE